MNLTRTPLRGHAWWVLVISGIFTLSVGLSNTFVNVYLWKVDKSYVSIGWYNLVVYCTIPIAFVVAGFVAKRIHSVLTMRIGIALHAAFYLVALLGGTTVAGVPAVLGLLMGLAAGFYWFSFNQLSLQFTDSDSRDRFYGLNGVMGAIGGMIAPPVAGYLISSEDRLGGLSGYHWTFGLSLVLFLVSILISLKLHVERMRGTLRMSRAMTELRVKPWRMTLIGCTVYGLREGVFLFLIGLLMYIATGSEMRLGEFVLLQNTLSFFSFFLVSRFVTPQRRLAVLGAGAVCMAAAALLFLLPITPRLIMWYGAIVAVSIPLFLVPLQGFIYDGIGALDSAKDYNMEHIIMREICENIGRVVGIGTFILLVILVHNARAIAYFAVVLGFMQIVTWCLIALGQRTPNNRAGEGLPRVRVKGSRAT